MDLLAGQYGLVDRFDGREAVCNLVCHDDGDIVLPSQSAQESTSLSKLVVAPGERLGTFLSRGLAELGTVIGCYAVYHDQADVMTIDGHGDLIA